MLFIVNESQQKNVLGEKLKICCFNPRTGYKRDGFCHSCEEDRGEHTICIFITDTFLQFSKKIGNDLSTPIPYFNFAGLKKGDRWCLCILRWVEALNNQRAPKVFLESSHESCLNYVSLETLKKYSTTIDK